MVYGHLDRRQVALTDLDFRCMLPRTRMSAVQYVKGLAPRKDGWRVERRALSTSLSGVKSPDCNHLLAQQCLFTP